MKPLLLNALDDLAGKEEKTLKVAEQLSKVEGNFGFKVNLDYLLNPEKGLKALLKPIQQFGRPVFSDIKMWNGTRTMASVIENLVALGVDYLNVYALADELLPKAIQITKGTKTKVFVACSFSLIQREVNVLPAPQGKINCPLSLSLK